MFLNIIPVNKKFECLVGLLIEIEIEIKIQIDKSLINFFFGNFEYFDQIY